ncbi:hypothetical protein [Streptomyces roseochromogenus]|uniref:Uncharacterized protein n=1 Tax=Streptomyces roseochromogenus subsp. oscitans DS 12.976 TaxID=1352936 RepID=V6JXH9_STRRC|nr:hypothetical protein [Streptomyces roseochromogenus]EST24393.1 hypothetical protein M878_30740 [Streptomyces roseochromogenus subsp. oscitans DS 12.976]
MTTPPGYAPDGPLIASWPRVLLEVAWNAGGNSTSPNWWYNLGGRLRGNWKAQLAGRQYELDAVQSGKVDFSLDNLDGAFDPDNTSSFFYPYVVPYRRCRLVLQVNPTRNLLYPWVAAGTSTLSMNATVGTTGTATGLPASGSGLTTAQTWAIPNGSSSGVAFGLNGDAGANWSTTDCDGTTVTPGLTYSFGIDVSLAAGGMTSLQLKARLAFYSLSGTLITRTLGTVQSVTTSWTRLTVSATAPSNAAWALVSISTSASTTAATTVQTTGWQLEQAAAPTSWVSPGTWAEIWQGFVERWPQTYTQNGKYGLVNVTAVDGLAPLSQSTIASAMASFVAQQNPQYRFDLAATGSQPDSPTGSAFLDLGGSGVGLDLVGGAITTGVSISSTSPLGTLWNTPGPVITLSNNQAASLGNASGASYLQWAKSSGKTVALPSAGWTRMICFRNGHLPGSGSTYTLASLWAATAAGFASGTGDQSGAYLYINSSGYVGCNIQNSAGTSLARVNSSVYVCDNNWHCAILSLSADGLTLHLTVDGTWFFGTAASSVGSSTYTQDAIGTLLADGGVNTQPFAGDLAWVAQWNTELSVSTQLDLTNGFANGWSGDANGTRLGRIMTLANFQPGAYSGYRIVGSDVYVGGASINGRSPLDVMQECADTEVGQFTVDRNGVPTLYGQLWRWIQTQPRVTFGENAGSGEIPYLGDVVFEQDPSRLYNDVQITVDGAQDLTNTNALQEAQDATSQTAYFPQTLARTLNPQTVQGGLNIANYLLSQYKDPHTRIQEITVDLASNPSLLPQVVLLSFADRVRVNKRPAEAPMKTLDCFIEQMEWSGTDQGALTLRMQMSPASQYQYGIIGAAWAQLQSSYAAGVSTITVGPISGSNLIAAQYVIPGGASYQMTLGYGTAAAETVTVQSVQAVSPGYSTVQITFTAPTANAHNANDYLCDPKPGNVALPPAGSYPTCFDAASLTGGTMPLIGF